MTVTGIIFALDLGSRCGFAAGHPGDEVRSGAVRLKEADETGAIAGSNLICFLQEQWSTERPALVVKEAPLHLEGFRKRANSNVAVRLTLGLHFIVESMAMRFGVRWEEVHPARVRKHFIGIGRMGERAETKAAVVHRCQVLGLLPRSSTDDDRADALAIHDYAVATWGGGRSRLFGVAA